MTFERKDLVQDISTTAGTAAFTPAGTPPIGMQPFTVHTVGATFRYRGFAGAQWEIGTGTWNGTTIARSVRKSSNGDALVNFTTAPTIMEVVDAADVSAFLTAADGTDVAGLASIAPVDTHKLILVDPSTGLAYTGTVAALRTLFSGTAPVGDTTAPVFGTGAALTSSSVTQTGFSLSWPAATDAVGVTRYEYSLDGGTSWTNVGNVLTASVTGRAAATTYSCRVRALDAAGNVSAQLSVSVTTAAAVVGNSAPTMSGSLTTSNVTATGYTMNWTAGTDPDGNLAGYDVSTDGGANFTQLGNVLAYAVTTASASTLYNPRVRARDAAGLLSNVLSATVTTSAPAGPTMASQYTLTPDTNGFPTAPATMTQSGLDKVAGQTISIYVKSADGQSAPAAGTLKFVWGKSSTTPPMAYADSHPPLGINGNQDTHTNDVVVPVRLANWTTPGQGVYGIYTSGSGFFAWGTPGTWYLWVLYSDGSYKAYDGNTGTPIGWVLN